MEGRLTLSALFANILEPDKEAISSEYTLLADLFDFWMTPIWYNGSVELRWWKSPFLKLRDETVKSFPTKMT